MGQGFAMPYGGRAYGGQRYAGMRYAGMRYAGQKYAGQKYGGRSMLRGMGKCGGTHIPSSSEVMKHHSKTKHKYYKGKGVPFGDKAANQGAYLV